MSQERSIKEQVVFLIKLQVVDREIYALNREKSQKPQELKSIEESLQSKKTGIKQAEDNLKALQVALKDKEVQLKQKEEQVEKLKLQLYQLKTNKEYSTMLAEIEGVKADNSLLEEEIIRLMDKIDASKKRVAEEKEIFKKEEETSRAQKDAISAAVKEIDSRLKELSIKRDEITPNIEKTILKRYQNVLENREGLAIVPIEKAACGGCHMNLPPQVVSEAKMKEEIVTCGSCNRILYVDDDVEIN